MGRVHDVSVSRVHALVSFDGNAFIVKDNGSKFQTLIRPQEQQLLDGERALRVQMGRTVFQMALLGIDEATEATTSGSAAAAAEWAIASAATLTCELGTTTDLNVSVATADSAAAADSAATATGSALAADSAGAAGSAEEATGRA